MCDFGSKQKARASAWLSAGEQPLIMVARCNTLQNQIVYVGLQGYQTDERCAHLTESTTVTECVHIHLLTIGRGVGSSIQSIGVYVRARPLYFTFCECERLLLLCRFRSVLMENIFDAFSILMICTCHCSRKRKYKVIQSSASGGFEVVFFGGLSLQNRSFGKQGFVFRFYCKKTGEKLYFQPFSTSGVAEDRSDIG